MNLTDGQQKTLLALYDGKATPFVGLQLVNVKRALRKLGLLSPDENLTAEGKRLVSDLTAQRIAEEDAARAKKAPKATRAKPDATKARDESLGKAADEPQEAPKAAKATKVSAKAPKAAAAPSKPPVWTPEAPYVNLVTSNAETVGYAKEESTGTDGQELGTKIWVAFGLGGTVVTRGLSQDNLLRTFAKKTGHKVSAATA